MFLFLVFLISWKLERQWYESVAPVRWRQTISAAFDPAVLWDPADLDQDQQTPRVPQTRAQPHGWHHTSCHTPTAQYFLPLGMASCGTLQLDRAIARINADPTLLPQHHVRHIFANSENGDGICSESIAPLMAVDLKFEHNPWAFIGPGCDYTSSPVGLFTAHWGLPMITAGAPAVAFMQMEMYTSITNTGPTHKKLGEYALHLYKHFGWHQHSLLMFSDTKMGERACYFALEGLYTEMHEDNITTMDLVFEENKGPVNYSELLHKIQDDGRGEWLVFVALLEHSVQCFWDGHFKIHLASLDMLSPYQLTPRYDTEVRGQICDAQMRKTFIMRPL